MATPFLSLVRQGQGNALHTGRGSEEGSPSRGGQRKRARSTAALENNSRTERARHVASLEQEEGCDDAFSLLMGNRQRKMSRDGVPLAVGSSGGFHRNAGKASLDRLGSSAETQIIKSYAHRVGTSIALVDASVSRRLDTRAGSMYSVREDALTPETKERVLDELTLRPTQRFPGAPAPKPIPAFERKDGWLRVPRPYGVRKWGRARTDNTSPGDPISSDGLRCIARPRNKAQRVMLSALRDSYAALRNTGAEQVLTRADCGCGKTVMALMHWLANREDELAEYSTRWPTENGHPPVAMFMPPTRVLRDQWAAEIRSLCPGTRVFILGAKTQNIPEGVDCIIALPHTVSRCEITKFDRVGFCVLDEAHHLTATTFMSAIATVRARRVLFLTATPRRKDGLTRKLMMLSGPMAAHVERPPMPVDARFVLYQRGRRRSMHYGPNLATSKMLSWLCEDPVRNRDIARAIKRCVEVEQARRILVISERSDEIPHLDKLDEALSIEMSADARELARCDEEKPTVNPERRRKRAALPELDAPRNASLQESTHFLAPFTSIIRSGTHAYEVEVAKLARVIFAPRRSCEEGFSQCDISHVIIASPFTDVEQCDGRGQREAPGKTKCVIYHFVDTFTPFFTYGKKVWNWRTHPERRRRMYTCSWVDESLDPIPDRKALELYEQVAVSPHERSVPRPIFDATFAGDAGTCLGDQSSARNGGFPVLSGLPRVPSGCIQK